MQKYRSTLHLYFEILKIMNRRPLCFVCDEGLTATVWCVRVCGVTLLGGVPEEHCGDRGVGRPSGPDTVGPFTGTVSYRG